MFVAHYSIIVPWSSGGALSPLKCKNNDEENTINMGENGNKEKRGGGEVKHGRSGDT